MNPKTLYGAQDPVSPHSANPAMRHCRNPPDARVGRPGGCLSKHRGNQELNPYPLLPQPSLPRSSVIVVGLVAGGARAVAVPCAVPGVAVRAAHCRALHRRRDVAPPGQCTTVHLIKYSDFGRPYSRICPRGRCPAHREQRCATREAPHSGSLPVSFQAKQEFAPPAYWHIDARLLTEAAPHGMCRWLSMLSRLSR